MSLTLGWPVPVRGGVKYDDYRAMNRMRSDAKRRLYLISTYPINVVLQEAANQTDAIGPPSISDPHYVVRVTHMPPTELECKCGTRREGPDCLDRMREHVREGNASAH